jgi:thiamine-monophosphate kinase
MREPGSGGSEFERIARIVAGLPPGEGVIVGPGDDAAVLRLGEGRDLVATCDALVEGRHFRRDLVSPAEAGARMAAANLSDLAAMAAEPRWALVSLALPPSWSAADAESLERACAASLAVVGAAIVGGNLSATDGPLVATVALLGEVERGRAWTRAGARPGDAVAVTGVPGSAAAFLALALWGNPPSRARVPEAIVARVVAPPSRVRLARALAATGAVHAAIDVSDGLPADLGHLCRASGVGARLEEARLPADEPLRAAARALSAAAGQERGVLPAGEGDLLTHLRLGPSDDYELLLAVEPGALADCVAIAAAHGTTLSRIGEVRAGNALELATRGGEVRPLEPRGWDHFAGPA